MVTEYDGSSLAKVFTPNSNNYREREYTGFNIYRALTSGGAYELIDNLYILLDGVILAFLFFTDLKEKFK